MSGSESSIEALEGRWAKALDDGCPHCGPVGFIGCDHIEGYHHALADLREAIDADNGHLLDRAEKAERALEELIQERNTWARQLADLRDERDTAVAQMETIRTNALGTENDMIADMVNLEARLLDERKDRAEVWDEGWKAAHIMLPTFPPKYRTNPYRDDSDHGVEKK